MTRIIAKKEKTCLECGRTFTGRRGSRTCSGPCAFWSNVDRSGGPDACWKWKLALNPINGYGLVSKAQSPHGKAMGAHRAAYRLHYCCDPGTLGVLHRCDKPACVNPRHLFLGTQRKNMLDALEKGRTFFCAPGSAHGRAKLTEDVVRFIRSSSASHQELAQRFGVTGQSIYRARTGKLWQHVF